LIDKSSRMIRDALCRAAAEPEGCALVAGKIEPGLFPSTALGKASADRCKADGYLHVIRTESKGKAAREICTLTEKGRHFLVQESAPREVIEDLVRVLESRQVEITQMTTVLERMQDGLTGLRTIVEQMLPRLMEPPVGRNGTLQHGTHMNGTVTLYAPYSTKANQDTLFAEVKAKLAEWHAAGATEDCSLPELYRRLEISPQPSIGQFHDVLRQLHEDQLIYLHPWTGPLYALPAPAYALMVGHEIGYYASIR